MAPNEISHRPFVSDYLSYMVADLIWSLRQVSQASRWICALFCALFSIYLLSLGVKEEKLQPVCPSVQAEVEAAGQLALTLPAPGDSVLGAVCLTPSRISQKLLSRFSLNLVEGSSKIQRKV